jgi:type II secretory pathway component HofQ
MLDGETVVVGGLFAEDFHTLEEKAPALRDLPVGPETTQTADSKTFARRPELSTMKVIGELFTNDSGDTRRHLVLLVTPTIIDHAGNRVHSPDRRTFDADKIPSEGPR